jgi:hypothetical protein
VICKIPVNVQADVRTFLVCLHNFQVHITVERGWRESLDLVGVIIIVDGIIREHALRIVCEDT